jgi:quercetin dioxygenase-like cupin family protein
MTRDPARLDLLGRAVPPGFEVCVVVVAPGCVRPYRAADWRDALVEVDYGQLELELCSGTRHRVIAGDLFWLDGLPVRALLNGESEPAVLVTLSRKQTPSKR